MFSNRFTAILPVLCGFFSILFHSLIRRKVNYWTNGVTIYININVDVKKASKFVLGEKQLLVPKIMMQ